jgi:hypothetical protein
MAKPPMADLVAAVRRHALDHYEKDGWDIVVECWSDDEIAAELATARTVTGAIKAVRKAVRPAAEHRDEIGSTAF